MSNQKNARFFYIAFSGFIEGKPAFTSQFASTDGSMLSFNKAIKAIKELTGHEGYWAVSFLFEFDNEEDYDAASKKLSD